MPDSGHHGFSDHSNYTNARMQALGDQWISEGGRQFDLAIVILAAINISAACLMIGNILYDAWSAARSLPLFLRRSLYRDLLRIHPAEVLPLVVSVAIVVQGSVFVVVQSRARNVITQKCQSIAQVIWPVLWLVPFTMLVFGLETTFRSLHGKRFQRQKWWHLTTALTAIFVITLAIWVPSNVFSKNGECLASLVWWTSHFAKLGLVIGTSLMFTFIVCACVISGQLLRNVDMHKNERIAATRIVYYLIVSTLTLALVIPFFVQAAMKRPAITVSKIASVAINVLGIVHLLLHIFLRSNADRTAIRPVKTSWGKKRRLRLFGPTDLEMTMHITSPVLSDSEDNCRLMADLRELQRKAKMKDRTLVEDKRMSCGSPDSEEREFSEKFEAIISPPQVALSRASAQNKSSYSIFPTHRSAMLRNSMSTTFSYGDEEGLPPPPTPLFSGRHKRDLSDESSATVQIGLRMSHLSHPLDPIDKNNSLHSFRFHSNPSPVAESQPVSPLSNHPPRSNRVPSDIVVLPIEANQLPTSDHTYGYGASLVVPGWLMRRESRSQAQQERERIRRMTMKALPPDPPTATPRTFQSV